MPGRISGYAWLCEVNLKRITTRLRKATRPLERFEQDSVGRVIATGWLRAVGVAIDPKTGMTPEVDWRLMRAESTVQKQTGATDEPESAAVGHR